MVSFQILQYHFVTPVTSMVVTKPEEEPEGEDLKGDIDDSEEDKPTPTSKPSCKKLFIWITPINYGARVSTTQSLLTFLLKNTLCSHYSDVIMGAMVSQFTSFTLVYSTVQSGADQDQVAVFYMSRQLSCRGMCRIVACLYKQNQD